MKTFTLIVFSFFLSLNAFAQKLPFQGQLIDNGTPYSGTVEMNFSIPDGLGGNSWAETQEVTVTDGLYSVVLGTVTPLPANLFASAGERQLNISVNGSALTPVTIYAAIGGSSNPEFFKDQNSGTEEDIAAVRGESTGTGVWSLETGNTRYSGVLGIGNALNGGNAGVRGIAFSHPGNVGFSYGVYGNANSAEGNTTGTVYGVRGDADGSFSYAVAVRGLASNSNPDGVNIGGDFSASTNPTENIGLRGIASGTSGRNIGVFGRAVGGTENWAGWFEGPVKVMGSHEANYLSSNGITGKTENTSIYLLGGNWMDGGENWQDRGALWLLSSQQEAQNSGINDRKVELTVADDGFGQSVGHLSLTGPHGDGGQARRFFEAGAVVTNGDGTAHGGRVFLRGSINDDPLVNLRVDRWEDGTENGFLTLRSSNGQEYHIGPNGGGLAGVGFGDKGWEPGLNGYLHVYGDTPEGTDTYRGGIEVNRDSEGNSSGALNLHGPVFTDPNNPNHSRGFVHANVRRDVNGEAPTEWAGHLDLNGHESPNVFIGANSYQDSDLGSITLFGNQPDPNSWWYNHAELSVGKNGDQQFGQLHLRGNNGNPNISLGAKSWETNGTNPGNRPFMHMIGNDPAQLLAVMEVTENDGVENGTINLRSTSPGHGIRMYGGQEFGGIKSHIALDGGEGVYVNIWGDGNIQATGDISANQVFGSNLAYSDRSLKENIKPLNNSLSNTLKLRGVSYNWIDKNKSQKNQIGVIAQEVEEIYPEFVHTNADGVKSVNYSQMVAVLIEAIKELNTQIETLKTENQSLKTELAKASDNDKRITELEASVKALAGLIQQQTKKDVSSTTIGSQE